MVEGTDEVIAHRLAEARQQRGWTLTQAATATGISVAHLSRLEKGDRQPSVGVLIQLSRCYGSSIGQLVGEDLHATCHVARGRDVVTHDGPDGQYAVLSGIVGRQLLEALRIVLPAGERTSANAQHPGEEWLYVVEGEVRLDLPHESVYLGSGDAAHFDAQAAHQLSNCGSGPTTVLILSTNGSGGPGKWHAS